jgi:hypothetical protein
MSRTCFGTCVPAIQLLYHVLTVNFHVSRVDPAVCYTLYMLYTVLYTITELALYLLVNGRPREQSHMLQIVLLLTAI